MSKRRLVITAVLAGQSQSEVARSYGVSQGWISRLMARYRAEGEAAFEPRSRAPKSRPTATPAPVGRAGAADYASSSRKPGLTLALTPSAGTWPTTTHATVTSDDQPDPGPGRCGHPAPAKRPKSSYLRFEADQPNETWQSDFTHYRLTNPDGTPARTEILTWLDDCSRYALSLTATPGSPGRSSLPPSGMPLPSMASRLPL